MTVVSFCELPIDPAGRNAGDEASAMPGFADVSADAGAHAVCRGIMRLFARNDIWCLPEMPLRGGRRADLMGIDAKGRVVIVEVKVAKADLMGDGKWPDYLEHCDRFYWGLPPHLDPGPLEAEQYRPDRCGLIVADGYDAQIVRPAQTHPLSAARRKVEVEAMARAAMRRLTCGADPECRNWGAAVSV